MFKTASGVSEVARLFKTTRVSQLQDAIADPLLNANGAFPSQQIVEAPFASFSRRDFGLKMRVPRLVKTRRIVVNDLDNQYGLPSFSTVNSSYQQKQKFREMGVAVQSQYKSQAIDTSAKFQGYNERKNPLFSSIIETLEASTIADALGIPKVSPSSYEFQKNIAPILRNLRRPFMKWLAVNHPGAVLGSYTGVSSERKSKNQYFIDFINHIKETQPELIKFNQKTIPDLYAKKLSGTAGLSYNLSGRLFQTPNGPQTHRIQAGRIVSEGNLLAVNGFTSHMKTVVNSSKLKTVVSRAQNESFNGVFSREVCIPLMVSEVKINLDNHKLNIISDPIGAKKATFKHKKTKTSGPASSATDMSSLMDLLKLQNVNSN